MENKQVMHRKTNSNELHLISCGYENCSSTQSYGPGVRRYYTIHFVLKGNGHFFVNDKHYKLNENQCFLIPPDVVTLYKAEPSDPWDYIWICFNGEQAAALLEHCHLSLSSPIQSFDSLKPYKNAILEMMKYPQLTPANECYIQSGLYRIMAMLQEHACSSYTDIESNDNFYISQAIEYINKSTFLDITVSDVADYLHISRSYLFELFKEHLHTTPQAFLTSAKIANARELLVRTDISIANIATSSGYQNPFAFSRAFKRETGMTPREYRERYHRTEDLLNC
ncbi:MAG: AraC family transcriptional regulator [Dorea sp.]